MPKNPLVTMLMCGVIAVWQLHDIATATEAPRRALGILQYVLLVCALLGVLGGGIRLATERDKGEGG